MENQIHPEAVAYQPQQQVMYTIQPQTPSGKVEQFNGRAATILGSLMIVLGILSIALGGAAFGIMASLYFIGSGIWCGFLFIVTGSLGIAAGRFKLKCLIITFMVLSIMIVCTACPTLLIISGTGLASDVQYMEYQSIICDTYNSFYTYVESLCDDKTELLAINALLVMACTVQAILCITSSAYCCRAVCCCCNKNVLITHDHIIGQGHQEVLTMTTSGQQDIPTMATIDQQGVPMTTIGHQEVPTMAPIGQQGLPTMDAFGQQGVPTMTTIGQQGVPTMATIGQQGVQIMPISDQSDNAAPVPQMNATSQQGVRSINIPPGYSITIQPTPEYMASVSQSQAVGEQPPQSWKTQIIE